MIRNRNGAGAGIISIPSPSLKLSFTSNQYPNPNPNPNCGTITSMVVSSAMVALFLHHFMLPPSTPVVPVQAESSYVGSLSVKVDKQLFAATVPRGTRRVPMLVLSLTASCEADVHVDSLTLKRVGMGNSLDIAAVYAMSGTRRISRARTVSRRDGLLQLRLNRFIVPACMTIPVEVQADFSTDAAVAGEHRLRLQSVDAGEAHTTVSPSRMPVIRRTAGPLLGIIEVEYLQINTPIRFGSNRTVSRIKLTANRDNNHAISAIRFTNDGSARGDSLQNLRIETSRDGQISHTAASLDGSSVYLKIKPPLILRQNQSRTLLLKTDIMSGVNKTIQFVIEEPSDIVSNIVRRR